MRHFLLRAASYQGEENTLILVSLVRSNPTGSIGFLRTTNRANVLLSRAKHGMFMVGNANTLRASNSPMWGTVLDLLQRAGQLAPALPLVCQNHPHTVTYVVTKDDFLSRARDGGCAEPCGARLAYCGHVCPRRCV